MTEPTDQYNCTTEPGNGQDKVNTISLLSLGALGAGFLLLIELFFLDVRIVQGTSMEPLYSTGDIVFINRLAYGFRMPWSKKLLFSWEKPQYDDIVVFKAPGSEIVLMKRCAALPGDPVYVRKNTVIIGNKAYFLSDDNVRMIIGDRIPAGTVFVIGENVTKSFDSRFFGFVPCNQIQGKVIKTKITKKT